MRHGLIFAAVGGALLASCGSGGDKTAGSSGGSTGGGLASALSGDWGATDACKLLDKSKVAAAAGSPVAKAELGAVTEAKDGMAALSTCTYTLENGGIVGVLTRDAPAGSKLADMLASAQGPEAKAMGMTFEPVAGVGKAALWNAKMDSLQVFYDDRRYAAINMMMAPKDADAKAVTMAVGKALQG